MCLEDKEMPEEDCKVHEEARKISGFAGRTDCRQGDDVGVPRWDGDTCVKKSQTQYHLIASLRSEINSAIWGDGDDE